VVAAKGIGTTRAALRRAVKHHPRRFATFRRKQDAHFDWNFNSLHDNDLLALVHVDAFDDNLDTEHSGYERQLAIIDAGIADAQRVFVETIRTVAARNPQVGMRPVIPS
jgi:hypothetical protein